MFAGIEFIPQAFKESVEREALSRSSAATARRHLPFLFLAIADHEHVGDFGQLGLTDLVPQFLVPVIDLGTQASSFEPVHDPSAVCFLALGESEHTDLDRGKPEWQGTTGVFEEDGDETLDRPQHGTV